MPPWIGNNLKDVFLEFKNQHVPDFVDSVIDYILAFSA